MNNWQPIETAPKDGTHIIGIQPIDGIYGGVTGVFWIPDKQRMFDGSKITIKGYWAESRHDQVEANPTHWMPLPELPKN